MKKVHGERPTSAPAPDPTDEYGLITPLCRAIFANSIDALLLLDDSGRYLEANPAGCALLGHSREELRNLTIFDTIHVSKKTRVQEWWPRFLKSGQDEGQHTGADSRGRVSTLQYRVVTVEPGQHLLVIRDISAGLQTEAELRFTQVMLNSILEHAPMPIYATGLDGTVRMANQAWEQYLGAPGPGIGLAELIDKITPATIQQFNDFNQAVLESKEPVVQEEWVDRPGEERLYFHTVKFPVFDNNGDVEAVGGISIDITAYRRAELVLRESEKKFRQLVTHSADGIVLADEEGRIVEWNAAQEEVTGIPAGQALGSLIWDIQFNLTIPQRSTPTNYERLKKATLEMHRTGHSPWLDKLWETDLQRPDGSRRRIQSHLFAIQTERGYMVGSISRDITQQRQFEEKINQRNRELSSLVKISQQLSGQLDLQQLRHNAVEVVIETLPMADTAALWIYDEETHQLQAIAAQVEANEYHRYEFSTPATSLVGKLFHAGKSIRIPYYRPGTGMLPSKPAMDHLRSMLGVPLMFKERTLGVLFAASSQQEDAFDEEAERWLLSMAGQIAVMIENARLFTQVVSARERMAALSARLVEVQEAERRRIARELHDEVGQILTGLKLLLRMAGHNLPASADSDRLAGLQQNLREAQDLTNELLNRVHDMSLDLRPAMLDDLGLLPALLWQFDRFSSQTGIKVLFRHHGLEGRRLAPTVETGAYRIIQEGLTNAARYAGVDRINVQVRVSGSELEIKIEDEGAGFVPEEQLIRTDRAGLNGMRERAVLLDGDFSVASAPGKGTRLRAVLPLGDRKEEADGDPNPSGG